LVQFLRATRRAGVQRWNCSFPIRILFKRFLEYRQRLHRLAAANGKVVMPASTDVGIRPEKIGTSNDAYGASSRGASATVHAAMPHGGMGIV
jgi:hypothetical protein